jgi:DNA-binding HxlR family transcriptional regulator
MFEMPGIVYFSLVEKGKTLMSPCLTIQWIRNVEKVRRRGGSLCRLTRAPNSIPKVNESYIIIN